MVFESEIKTGPINKLNCEDTEQKLLDILNSSQLSLRELLYVVGRFLVDLGGSLEGVDQKISYEDMWRRYATQPGLGNALMALGADILVEWLKFKETEDEDT